MRLLKKIFLGFTVHSVHLSYLYSNFIVLGDDQTVKGEQLIAHPVEIARMKKTGCCRSDVSYVAVGRHTSAASRRCCLP